MLHFMIFFRIFDEFVACRLASLLSLCYATSCWLKVYTATLKQVFFLRDCFSSLFLVRKGGSLFLVRGGFVSFIARERRAGCAGQVPDLLFRPSHRHAVRRQRASQRAVFNGLEAGLRALPPSRLSIPTLDKKG